MIQKDWLYASTMRSHVASTDFRLGWRDEDLRLHLLARCGGF